MLPSGRFTFVIESGQNYYHVADKTSTITANATVKFTLHGIVVHNYLITDM